MSEGMMLKVIMSNGKEYQFIVAHPEDFIAQFYDRQAKKIKEGFVQAKNYQGNQILLNARYISSIEYSIR